MEKFFPQLVKTFHIQDFFEIRTAAGNVIRHYTTIFYFSSLNFSHLLNTFELLQVIKFLRGFISLI